MEISVIGVVGAGQMGNGIAHVMALAGYNVLLNDINADALEKAVSLIDKNLARQVLGNALSFARLAWHHKGKVGAAATGLWGAAKWVLAHETWLLETFANNPSMREMIEQLLAFLKTLPF